MTPESRLGVLNGLLERVRQNAREPRPTFLDFWDRPTGKRPSRVRPTPVATTDARANEPVAQRAENGVGEVAARASSAPSADDFLLGTESAPPPTAPGRGREALLAFGDESTQTGDPAEAERLVLLEQEEAARQQEIRPLHAARPPSAPPTPRSPGASTTAASIELDDLGADGSLVIDDFELSGPAFDGPGDVVPGPATQPPGAAELPDVEAIENDALDIGLPTEPDALDAFDPNEAFRRADPRATLTNEAALERARAESLRPSEPKPRVEPPAPKNLSLRIPPPPRAPAPPPPPVSGLELRADDAPSSERKPVQLDRPVDDAFDGFGPVTPPSEPPESGEIPSQRRLLTPPRLAAVSDPDADAIEVHLDSVPPEGSPESSREVPAKDATERLEAASRSVSSVPPAAPTPRPDQLGAGLPTLGGADDDDDFAGETRLFRKSERPFADDVASADADASVVREDDDVDDQDDRDDAYDDDEDVLASEEADATKEIRTMGRVDVVERQPLSPAEVIVLSESRQKAPSTFGDLLDLALSIGP